MSDCCGGPFVPSTGTTGGGGASGTVTAQQTAIVDPAFGDDVTGAFGDLGLAFKTIQAAINAVPTPAVADGVASRTVWTIIVSPGTYDEDLAIDLTRKRIILASWGPWNLGLFNSADWAPSGVRRNITITCGAVINDGIRNGFSIQPMLPAGEGLTTHQAYLTRPRISGKIDVSGMLNSIELTLSAEVFGTTGSAAGDSIVGGATVIQSYIYHSRFRGKITGSNWNFQVNERTRFGGLVTISGYSTIISCRFDAGMTTTSAVNAGILPDGFFDTDFAGTFTGPASSFRIDQTTNYWFTTNGGVLAGGATKQIQEIDPIGAWIVIGPFTSVGAPHPVAIGELAQADVSLGGFGFTLPAVALGNKGRQIAIKKVAGGAAIVTAIPAGADTVEGIAAPFSIFGALASITLVSNGVSNWMVI